MKTNEITVDLHCQDVHEFADAAMNMKQKGGKSLALDMTDGGNVVQADDIFGNILAGSANRSGFLSQFEEVRRLHFYEEMHPSWQDVAWPQYGALVFRVRLSGTPERVLQVIIPAEYQMSRLERMRLFLAEQPEFREEECCDEYALRFFGVPDLDSLQRTAAIYGFEVAPFQEVRGRWECYGDEYDLPFDVRDEVAERAEGAAETVEWYDTPEEAARSWSGMMDGADPEDDAELISECQAMIDTAKAMEVGEDEFIMWAGGSFEVLKRTAASVSIEALNLSLKAFLVIPQYEASL